MNKGIVFHALGGLAILLAAIMLVPLGIALCCGARPEQIAFAIAILAAFCSGIAMRFRFKHEAEGLGACEAFAIVTFGWVSLTFFGCLPFWLSGACNTFCDAYFETMSGFTTTGATILTDIRKLPMGIMFWRSLTHWLGGMGIVVFFVAVLPALGAGAYQLFRAEAPGPTADRITPRIGETAKRLWAIYVLLTLAETLLLWAGPMSLYDALCHTFGTMATGGFSTRNASIAHYDSAYVDWVIILFMFLAGCNFALHYQWLTGNVRGVWRNSEFRFFVVVLAVAIVLVSSATYFGGVQQDRADFTKEHLEAEAAKVKPLGSAIRHSTFQVLSMTTTTGFCTANFDIWPHVCRVALVVLMFAGGCAGSTGGGIKHVRVMLVLKYAWRELTRLARPRSVVHLKVGGKVVPEPIVANVAGFFVIYMALFALGSIIMTALGLDLATGVTSVVATLSNIGPGLGGVGAVQNYADIPYAGKWVLTLLMLLGRLEVFSVLVLFVPLTWKR